VEQDEQLALPGWNFKRVLFAIYGATGTMTLASSDNYLRRGLNE
jgi:hypothetical protein